METLKIKVKLRKVHFVIFINRAFINRFEYIMNILILDIDFILYFVFKLNFPNARIQVTRVISLSIKKQKMVKQFHLQRRDDVMKYLDSARFDNNKLLLRNKGRKRKQLNLKLRDRVFHWLNTPRRIVSLSLEKNR